LGVTKALALDALTARVTLDVLLLISIEVFMFPDYRCNPGSRATAATKRLLKTLIVLALTVSGNLSLAADAGKIRRVGFLTIDTPAMHAKYSAAFARGMAEGGYVEGRNLIIERKFAGNDLNTLPGLMAELIALNVEVLAADATPPALAAKQATQTIPIVAISGDPVGAGLVKSLSNPGGNVTALATMGPDIIGKRLAFLKEIVPHASRVALLWNAGNPVSRIQVEEARPTAAKLGLRLYLASVQHREEIDGMLASLPRVDAIVLTDDAVFDSVLSRIQAFAAQKRLPLICYYRIPNDNSCMLWYGPDIVAVYRRLGVYAARMLGGSRPADLPVEQPTTYELVVNLNTAKGLGVTIPQSILLQANEIIK
jgi:putative ABC transport system substrate-binding protein